MITFQMRFDKSLASNVRTFRKIFSVANLAAGIAI